MHSASVKYLRHFNSQVANPSIFRAGDPLTLWKHVAASKNVTLREYVPLFFFFPFPFPLSLFRFPFFHSIANAAVPFPAFTVHITRLLSAYGRGEIE